MDLTKRYDFGTFVGALGGLLLIVTAIMRGGSIDIFLSLSSLMIVVGGALSTQKPIPKQWSISSQAIWTME